jgi:hypothetical protein
MIAFLRPQLLMGGITKRPFWSAWEVNLSIPAQLPCGKKHKKLTINMQLAAESHVDHSIRGLAPFMEIEIIGTYASLDAALQYWSALDAAAQQLAIAWPLAIEPLVSEKNPRGSQFAYAEHLK